MTTNLRSREGMFFFYSTEKNGFNIKTPSEKDKIIQFYYLFKIVATLTIHRTANTILLLCLFIFLP